MIHFGTGTAAPVRAAALVCTCLLLVPAGVPSEPDSPSENPRVEVVTSMGNFQIELFPDRSPITVANFLRYVDEDFYAGTIFHRVIKGILIEGGGLSADLTVNPTYPAIENEADNGLMHDAWTVAATRTMGIKSATSQFFVNLYDNMSYNHRGPQPTMFGSAVFGRVISGRDVVTAINRMPTEVRRPHQKVPVKPIVIETIRRVVIPAAAVQSN